MYRREVINKLISNNDFIIAKAKKSIFALKRADDKTAEKAARKSREVVMRTLRN